MNQFVKMTDQQFDKRVATRVKSIQKVLSSKGIEYGTGKDRMHNFNHAAQMDGIYPEEACHGMMMKHLVSYKDIQANLLDGDLPTAKHLKEKVGDLINYLILFEAMVLQRIEDGE